MLIDGVLSSETDRCEGAAAESQRCSPSRLSSRFSSCKASHTPPPPLQRFPSPPRSFLNPNAPSYLLLSWPTLLNPDLVLWCQWFDLKLLLALRLHERSSQGSFPPPISGRGPDCNLRCVMNRPPALSSSFCAMTNRDWREPPEEEMRAVQRRATFSARCDHPVSAWVASWSGVGQVTFLWFWMGRCGGVVCGSRP